MDHKALLLAAIAFFTILCAIGARYYTNRARRYERVLHQRLRKRGKPTGIRTAGDQQLDR